MNPADFLSEIIDRSLPLLEEWTGIKAANDRARLLLLAIAGQESGWIYRKQIGGPAHGFWQFEAGGGVLGVLHHPASGGKIRVICERLAMPCTLAAVYDALVTNDFLACAVARLLLYTDPAPLPELGQVEAAWGYYKDNWRPGMPRPGDWRPIYERSLALVKGVQA